MKWNSTHDHVFFCWAYFIVWHDAQVFLEKRKIAKESYKAQWKFSISQLLYCEKFNNTAFLLHEHVHALLKPTHYM
jgi:hypothetical protein